MGGTMIISTSVQETFVRMEGRRCHDPPPSPEPFLISGSRRSVNDYDAMNALLENQWFPAVMQMVMIPWILRKIQQFTAVLQWIMMK
jgi:hypothetical protein